jgi:hypothetical protein
VHLVRRPVAVDPEAIRWITTSLRRDHSVGSLVPPVFQAYARVFHPAVRFAGDDDIDVRWAEVAEVNGTVAHPAMEWGSITGSMDFFEEADQPPTWNDAPARGHLPRHVAARVVDILRAHTATPDDCFIGVDSGIVIAPDEFPVVPLGGTSGDVLVLRGPIELAATNVVAEPFDQSPSVWWPADRSWYVATNLDLVTTYVGGTAACIAELTAAGDLETAPVQPHQGITWDTDDVNPLPDRD